jgi:myosin heavy subunit
MSEPEGQSEPVEQIAQNLANEILKLVKASNGADSSAAPEVVIDDEASAETPAAPAPEAPAAPDAQPPMEEEEIFEIAMDEIGGEAEVSEEDGLQEFVSEEAKEEEFFEIDAEETPKLDLPTLEETEELEEVKMQGVSNSVQKSQAVSAGPELAVKNRGRQNGKDNVPHARLEESENKIKAQYESKLDELTQENKRLNESVKESANLIKSYKESFVDLRKQFDEMQTFNAKLAYANKIFASGGLSTDEKTKIAEQFDKTESVDEAKKLYDSIIKENKVSVNTNNVNKIKSPTINAVKPKNEPLYENAEMKRMKSLAGIGKNEDELI